MAENTRSFLRNRREYWFQKTALPETARIRGGLGPLPLSGSQPVSRSGSASQADAGELFVDSPRF